MPTPILTSILDDVKTSLEAITTANGYWDTVDTVRRFGGYAVDLRGASLPVALVAPSGSQIVRQNSTGGSRMIDRVVEISIWMGTKGRTTGDDDWAAEEKERMEAAIAKALGADPKRSALAIDTRYVATDFFPEDPAEVDASVALSFEIEYQTQMGDFETSAP